MTCLLEHPKEFGSFWVEGEPKEDGYYLVRVNGRGNPWVFLSRVVIDRTGDIAGFMGAIYSDHYSGDTRYSKFLGGEAVAHCEPTGENFERALFELKVFGAHHSVLFAKDYWDLWECTACGAQRRMTATGDSHACSICLKRDTVHLKQRKHRYDVIDCPGCDQRYCVAHDQHLKNCLRCEPPKTREAG